jgi:hypothetical protein
MKHGSGLKLAPGFSHIQGTDDDSSMPEILRVWESATGAETIGRSRGEVWVMKPEQILR